MRWRLYGRVLVVAVPLTTIILIYLAPSVAAFIYSVIAGLAPLWLPVLLAAILWPVWLTTIRSWYVSKIKYITLELKPGDNTPKTARPMELVFYSLYYRTEISLKNSLLKGAVRIPWSFDVCATNGTVRFFIHIPAHHRPAVEGRIRAEYRDIDIDEARDYSRELAFNPFESRLEMREYILEKSDAFPLRTYVSHEHGKDRRDVFGELLENIASFKEHEHLWISLLVRPHQRDWKPGFWGFLEEPRDSLHDDAYEEIHRILGASGDIRNLPQTQQELVLGIENALKKPSFDCGIRAIYIAQRNVFDESRVQELEHLFDGFGDPVLNNYTAYDPREQISWPLSDVFAAIPSLDMEYFLKLYRRRAFFAPPYYGKTFILNAEELATMYHMPKAGRASALNRSSGSRLAPPENLPI